MLILVVMLKWIVVGKVKPGKLELWSGEAWSGKLEVFFFFFGGGFLETGGGFLNIFLGLEVVFGIVGGFLEVVFDCWGFLGGCFRFFGVSWRLFSIFFGGFLGGCFLFCGGFLGVVVSVRMPGFQRSRLKGSGCFVSDCFGPLLIVGCF